MAFVLFHESVYYRRACGYHDCDPIDRLDHPRRAAREFLQWPVSNGIYTSPGPRESQSALFLWQLCLVAWHLGNIPGLICGGALILPIFSGKVRTIMIRQLPSVELNYTDLNPIEIFYLKQFLSIAIFFFFFFKGYTHSIF